jgi:hypothetical protein
LVTTLFIEADEPLLVLRSIEEAERHLEAVDVRNGVYRRAYGRDGEPFSITTDGNNVLIRSAVEPADPEGLRDLLQRSLLAVGQEISTMPIFRR